MAFKNCANTVSNLDEDDSVELVDAYDRYIDRGLSDKKSIKAAINEVIQGLKSDREQILELATASSPQILNQQASFEMIAEDVARYAHWDAFEGSVSGKYEGEITQNGYAGEQFSAATNDRSLSELVPDLYAGLMKAADMGLSDPAMESIMVPNRYNDFMVANGGELSTQLTGRQAVALNDAIQDLKRDGMGNAIAIPDVIAGFPDDNFKKALGAFTPAVPARGMPKSLQMNSNMLDAAYAGNVNAQKALRTTLAHELGHASDLGMDGSSSTWDSPLMRFDPFGVSMRENPKKRMGVDIVVSRVNGKPAVGAVMQEAINMVNSQRGEKNGLAKFLEYPLMELDSIILRNSTMYDTPIGDVFIDSKFINSGHPLLSGIEAQRSGKLHMIQAEVFAQIHALYYTNPA